MKSLVLFGDSLLARVGTDLMDVFNSKISNVRIYNCAAGGMQSTDGLKQVNLISKLKPDYVLLSFGANDAAWWKPEVSIEEYSSNLSKIIKSFRGTKVLAFPVPPVNDPASPKDTAKYNKLLHAYNAVLKEVCSKSGATFLETEGTYRKMLQDGRNYHDEDGIHINDNGYKVMINAIASAL